MQKKKPEINFLDETINTSKKAFIYVLLFSMAANVLMLGLPIYTLQVLDRVISSGSMETLLMLTIIMVVLFIAFGLFQLARTMTLIRIGEWFDKKVGAKILAASLAIRAHIPSAGTSQNLRDMLTLKNFLTGPGLSAIFDAPWSLVYLLVLYLIHPVQGTVALIGSIILIIAAVINEKAVKGALNEANEMSVKTMNHVEVSGRNAEVIEAMGMMNAITKSWQKKNEKVLSSQTLASNRSGVVTSAAKSFRMLLQIIIMGSGALLVLNQELTVGGMIACSILTGRVLAPFEAAIAAWSSVASTRKAYQRLTKAIEAAPIREQTIDLPTPEGRLSVEKVIFAAPGSSNPILKGVGFPLNPGETLGIIGPSAAGKSTLAKIIVGVWQPNSGVVRLDGADVYTWNREDFGKHIGYLPQDVELFAGTVKENIARMRSDVEDEDIIAAAKITGVHDMILRLPNGYETEMGIGGENLSAGQRQRIGLARAFFGNPKLLVLDEPNSNLDEAGENALAMAMKNAKALKITTIIIAHRPAILSSVDKLLVLRDGAVLDFGPTQEILGKYVKTVGAPAANPQISQTPPAAVSTAPVAKPADEGNQQITSKPPETKSYDIGETKLSDQKGDGKEEEKKTDAKKVKKKSKTSNKDEGGKE